MVHRNKSTENKDKIKYKQEHKIKRRKINYEKES